VVEWRVLVETVNSFMGLNIDVLPITISEISDSIASLPSSSPPPPSLSFSLPYSSPYAAVSSESSLFPKETNASTATI
jgi:hypothetical protein